MAEPLLQCRRFGCRQKYLESENGDEACRYHSGIPAFRDLSKKWTCCGVEKYDWDEFMKVPGCCVGRHSDVKPIPPKPQEENPNAPQRIVAAPEPVPIRSNPVPAPQAATAPQSEEESKAEAPKEEVPTKPFITKSGKYKCVNLGCNQEYDPEDNGDDVCSHHTGKPVFHDLKKMWSCCGAKSYDWDEFTALPKCTRGRHVPKMQKA